MSETGLIEVKDLKKRFGDVVAVDGVGFSMHAGQCFGLLGPNGAGKTTTIEMMEGIKLPDSGEVLYRGQPLGHDFRAEAGIMFQTTALPEFITVRELLVQFSRFYPHTTAIETLVENYALEEFLDQDSRKLSGGQKQRLLLAVAMINQPRVLFLDEPTTGLDPQSRRNLWEQMRQVKAAGTTILLTTHYMEEAYELCDEIAIMDHGKIIAQGEPDALLKKHFNDVVVQLPSDDVPLECDLESIAAVRRGDAVHIVTGDVNHSIEQLLAMDVPLDHLRIRARDLEDLFLELTGRGLRQ
ncbi:MAG: ABC transporter ATP-binding protein [Pseudomonadota bacterium]